MSIVLLGRTGYIGSAFEQEINARVIPTCCLSRSEMDYTDRDVIHAYLRARKPDVLINCAAFIPQSGPVDDCKHHMPETWRGNVHLPVMLAQVCQELGITFCHISTGCLYDEEREYVETDFPTRFQHEYAFPYLATKFFSESVIRNVCDKHYLWRIRLPFDEFDHPRNFLTKIRQHEKVWDHRNSLTHRGDFVKAALDMIEKKVMFGTYHCCCTGTISTREIISMLEDGGSIERGKQFTDGPVPGCSLSTDKLSSTGIPLRPVGQAVEQSINQWKRRK